MEFACAVGCRHGEHPPVGRGDHLARVLLLVAQGMKEIQEAPLREMVRGELLYPTAAKKAEIHGHLQQTRSDSSLRSLGPGVLRHAPSLSDVAKVVMEFLRSHPKRS